jgi:hypothetical protein
VEILYRVEIHSSVAHKEIPVLYIKFEPVQHFLYRYLYTKLHNCTRKNPYQYHSSNWHQLYSKETFIQRYCSQETSPTLLENMANRIRKIWPFTVYQSTGITADDAGGTSQTNTVNKLINKTGSSASKVP